jgi:hypothetical protein
MSVKEKKIMKARMYDIYDGEKFVDTLNSDEAAKLINISVRSIYAAASGGYKLKRKYYIVPVSDECQTKSFTQELCEEWDKTRLEILHKGRVNA